MATGSRTHRGEYPCPACGARLLRQLVSHMAALDVTAELRPLTPDQQARARGPDRLIWCLHTTAMRHLELRWIHTDHPASCPKPHVAPHQCPGRPQPQPALF